jgi:long-chain fatty acid transport protein
MRFTKNNLALAAAVAATVAAPSAFATNGYFTEGEGTLNRGMAGAGVALPLEPMAIAVNPAGLTKVGNALEVGLGIFAPKRHTDISGNNPPFPPFPPPASLDTSASGDENKYFYIPSIAYSAAIDAESSWGVAIYANGGMQTRYKDNVLSKWAAFSPTGYVGPDTGVDLQQLFINGTYARKIGSAGSVGVSGIFARQMFKAYGLQPFDNAFFSSSPGHVTNNGYDSSNGFGIRIGGLWDITDAVSVGASYQSKIKGKFKEYEGLFAEQGEFDIPSNYTVGVAWKAAPGLAVALDYMKIKYTDSKSVSNPLDASCLAVVGTGTCKLGDSGGPGFGWKDINVFKLGAQFEGSDGWTWRAGYNHGDNPIPSDQVFFNILAPGVVQDHLNVGFTKAVDKMTDVNFMFDHAFKKTVTGPLPSQFGGGTASISLEENYAELGFAKKF